MGATAEAELKAHRRFLSINPLAVLRAIEQPAQAHACLFLRHNYCSCHLQSGGRWELRAAGDMADGRPCVRTRVSFTTPRMPKHRGVERLTPLSQRENTIVLLLVAYIDPSKAGKILV